MARDLRESLHIVEAADRHRNGRFRPRACGWSCAGSAKRISSAHIRLSRISYHVHHTRTLFAGAEWSDDYAYGWFGQRFWIKPRLSDRNRRLYSIEPVELVYLSHLPNRLIGGASKSEVDALDYESQPYSEYPIHTISRILIRRLLAPKSRRVHIFR